MKNLIKLTTILFLATSIVSCGKKSDNSSSDDDPTTLTEMAEAAFESGIRFSISDESSSYLNENRDEYHATCSYVSYIDISAVQVSLKAIDRAVKILDSTYSVFLRNQHEFLPSGDDTYSENYCEDSRVNEQTQTFYEAKAKLQNCRSEVVSGSFNCSL